MSILNAIKMLFIKFYVITYQVKIWFQNRRYKCKRQLTDKPLESGVSVATSPETPSVNENSMHKLADESINSIGSATSAGPLGHRHQVSIENDEPVVMSNGVPYQDSQQPASGLPPYSSLYNPPPMPYASGTGYNHQEMSYACPVSAPPAESSGYYGLVGNSGSNVSSAQSFHQHSFSSSVRAW